MKDDQQTDPFADLAWQIAHAKSDEEATDLIKKWVAENLVQIIQVAVMDAEFIERCVVAWANTPYDKVITPHTDSIWSQLLRAAGVEWNSENQQE